MVTVQTEHLENHTARLTVDVPAERIEKAVRDSARQVAKKARIPGFRPGKAPFNVIVGMFGYDYLLNEALEKIGNDVYKEALEQAQLEPYAPGSLEDVEDQGQKMIFIVPKRPEIDLGDYRAIRVEYEVAEVTDEMVHDAMEDLREQQAVIEDVDRPAAMGDQVEIEHFYVGVLEDEDDDDEATSGDSDDESTEDAAEDTPSEDAEAAEGDADDDDADDEPAERQLFHQHDWTRVLRDDDKDLFPGFSAELVGAVAGDELEFYLDLPEDYTDETLAGKRLRFEAHIAKVQARTVPEWSDDLAKRIAGEDDEETETILQLRMSVREQLESQAKSEADREAAEEALDKLVEGATLSYPEEVVEDYLDEIVEDLEQNMLKPQGFDIDRYLTLVGQTRDEFRATFRANAVRRAERALALGKLVDAEQLLTTDADIDGEISKMIADLGGEERAGQFRQYFDTPHSRMNIANQMTSDRAIGRLLAIAKGEEPPVGVPREDVAEDTAGADAGEASAADVVADAVTETGAAADVVQESAGAADGELAASDAENMD